MDDDEGLWVPLVRPRHDDYDDDEDEFLPPEEPRAQGSSEKWLANTASHFSGDGCARTPFPMRRLQGSVIRVPDFSQIPRERWEEAMRTIPERQRLLAIRGVCLTEGAELAAIAMSDLPPAPSDLARIAIAADPGLASTLPSQRTRRANRQVNFRLTDSEYADLATAAKLVDMSAA